MSTLAMCGISVIMEWRPDSDNSRISVIFPVPASPKLRVGCSKPVVNNDHGALNCVVGVDAGQ